MIKKYNKFNYILMTIYGVICSTIFFLIFYLGISTDLQLHVQYFVKYLNGNSFPIPPLYYFSIYLFDFFSRNIILLYLSSIFVLTIASIAKFQLTLYYLNKGIVQKSFIIGILTFVLMFFFPVVILGYEDKYWYLGKFTSIIWHNSTTIFVFPLCIYLFILTLNYLEESTFKYLPQLLLISVLIILSKPSFLFAYIPILPLITIIYEKRLNSKFVISLSISVSLLLLILILQYLIYNIGTLDQLIYKTEKSEVIFVPFKVWFLNSENPILDIISSFLFLFAYIIFNVKKLISDNHFIFSFLMLMVSIAVYLSFAESGIRLMHGNFYWQIPITLFIVYMTIVKQFIFNINELIGLNKFKIHHLKLISFRNYLLITLFILHILSGFAYIFRLLIVRTYY